MGSTNPPRYWRIGLAAARNYPSLDERLHAVDRFLAEAARQDVAIVCFPETYLSGLRGMDFPVPPHDQASQETALETVRLSAKRHRVAVVVGMEWGTTHGLLNAAFVISREGDVLGYQSKNQIPLEEAAHYVPGTERHLFEIDGVPFGITICHEGWRYPEATRWAAVRGALVVFHPQLTGSDRQGPTLQRWGDPDSPYYEKAMIMRSIENTIWFASVNNAFRYQESATSLIDPEGNMVAHVPYGEEELLVHDLDLSLATRLIANRYNPDLYPPLARESVANIETQ
jgi:predicted amidohydrolase